MTVQVVLSIMEAVSPAPIMEPVESDVAPTQAPVIVGVGLGPVIDGPVPPHAAVVNAAVKLMTLQIRMAPLPPLPARLVFLRSWQLLCQLVRQRLSVSVGIDLNRAGEFSAPLGEIPQGPAPHIRRAFGKGLSFGAVARRENWRRICPWVPRAATCFEQPFFRSC